MEKLPTGVLENVVSFCMAAQLRDVASTCRAACFAVQRDPRIKTQSNELAQVERAKVKLFTDDSWKKEQFELFTPGDESRSAWRKPRTSASLHGTVVTITRDDKSVQLSIPENLKECAIANAEWPEDVPRPVLSLRLLQDIFVLVYPRVNHLTAGKPLEPLSVTNVATVTFPSQEEALRALEKDNDYDFEDVHKELWMRKYNTVTGLIAVSGDARTIAVISSACFWGPEASWSTEVKVKLFHINDRTGALIPNGVEVEIGKEGYDDGLHFGDCSIVLTLSACGGMMIGGMVYNQFFTAADLFCTEDGSKVTEIICPDEEGHVWPIFLDPFQRDNQLIFFCHVYEEEFDTNEFEVDFPALLHPRVYFVLDDIPHRHCTNSSMLC